MKQKTRRVLLLRKLRRDREMTQRELGKLVGLHPAMISLIEKGERDPSLNKARGIAAVFKKPIEELFSYVEVPA